MIFYNTKNDLIHELYIHTLGKCIMLGGLDHYRVTNDGTSFGHEGPLYIEVNHYDLEFIGFVE